MEKTIEIYQSMIQTSQNQEDFDYILQAILFEISFQDRNQIIEIAHFIKEANLSVSLLGLINEICDTSFTWSMLEFLDDNAFVFMIDLIHKLLGTLVKGEVDLNAIQKIVDPFCSKVDIQTILQHY